MSSSARDAYLASLDPDTELSARRIAEKSGIPDNDPMWLLLYELQRSLREATAGANAVLSNEPFAQRLSAAVGARIAGDERIVDALTAAIHTTQDGSMRAIRSLENSIRDFARRRALAPLASLAFALALAIIISFAAIWSTYHIAVSYGHDLGYRSGFDDGITYERSHR